MGKIPNEEDVSSIMDGDAMPVSASSCFPLKPGDSVTAWALSAIEETPFAGESDLAEDRVQYRFINGFVDVGDLPCRRALWACVKTRNVALEKDWIVESINLPGFNRRLEFSSFRHRPTWVKRWCRTQLKPEHDTDVSFKLATCGGVHIWVDGVLAVKFEPFQRNHEFQTEVTLPLKASGSEIIMLTEDLAERDFNWYVELTLLSEESLLSIVESGAEPALMNQLMALARDVCPHKDVFCGDPLILDFGLAPDRDVTIDASILPSVHMRDDPPILSSQSVLSAGQVCARIEGLEDLAEGYHALNLVFSVGETRIYRQIGFALLRDLCPRKLAAGLAERKRQALQYAAENGEKRVGRALAILAHEGTCTPLCAEIIETTLEAVNERVDCSDFVLVPLLWLYGAYRDKLPQELCEKIEQTILDYRYWVDEPGNDVMWFWSENHVLCFHTSEYLAGLLFSEATFSNSDRTGATHLALAEERLSKWFDAVEAHGFAEWNSAAYYPIDFIGLLALEHWGKGSIGERARGLLDALMKMIALHTLCGVPAGSMGRAYDKELRAGPLTELAPFASVAFGQGWLNIGVAALPMFLIGDYTPPAGLDKLVTPPEGEALIAHYVQGYHQAARLGLYKSCSVQLSASIDSKAGAQGHQQHMLDIRFADHPFARAWVNHPGEDDPWGHQRPSYWAGNGSIPRVGLYGNAGLMLFDIADNHRIDFTHIYAPIDCFDEWALFEHWLILRSGTGFAALSPCGALEQVETGPGKDREFRFAGRKAGWVVLVGDLARGGELDVIKDYLGKTKTCFDDKAMTLRLSRPGEADLLLDYSDGLFVDGKQHPFPNPDITPRVSSCPVKILEIQNASKE